ncbi:chitin-binding protein [Bacillus wiedmannii]|uniref:chitin-binding protein n=1 Tax=Bacillus wiedmannii TaxID=1890302 RepID=UPI000BEE1485|nr:chitin-binding protein [Bacillus wiedmannii]PEC58309.1 chitin-binding protein [Bacillus wiedmannii]PEL93310.1 chitin-binding protein [Bacillus wiedmannii]PGB63864.1 chitin-binding protein [Bacillus wiedmannii]
MKRGQKRKTINLVIVTAALSMFATGITPSLKIFAEEQAQQQKVYEAVQNHQRNGDSNWIFALSLWKPLILNF